MALVLVGQREGPNALASLQSQLLAGIDVAVSPFAGSVAAVGLGLWLGGLLMELEAPRSPPAANTTLAAMSVFGAVPPGNLCPRAGACGASGNAR